MFSRVVRMRMMPEHSFVLCIAADALLRRVVKGMMRLRLMIINVEAASLLL